MGEETAQAARKLAKSVAGIANDMTLAMSQGERHVISATAESRDALVAAAGILAMYADRELRTLSRYADDKAIADFTRVCDQTGMSEKLRKE